MLETIAGHRSLPEHERKRGGSQREPASAFKPPPQRARADAKAVLVGDGCVITVAATKPNHTLPSSVLYSSTASAWKGFANLLYLVMSPKDIRNHLHNI